MNTLQLISSTSSLSSSINNKNINANKGRRRQQQQRWWGCCCPEKRKSSATILVAANSRSSSSSSSSSGPSWNSKSMTEAGAPVSINNNNNNNNKWVQKTVTVPPHPRGCHLITPKILKEIGKELSEFQCGLAHFFLQHTSASLTINENYDSDVRHDTETFLNRIVPEGSSAPWQHTLEGPDDMPAHIKSSMFGCSLMIPISKGQLNMGTWQGIWLCEHRDLATSRKVVVTLNGI